MDGAARREMRGTFLPRQNRGLRRKKGGPWTFKQNLKER